MNCANCGHKKAIHRQKGIEKCWGHNFHKLQPRKCSCDWFQKKRRAPADVLGGMDLATQLENMFR